MSYDDIFILIYNFANYTFHGMLLCRILAPIILVSLLLISRLTSSFLVKLFAMLIALIIYFLPDVINIFIIDVY